MNGKLLLKLAHPDQNGAAIDTKAPIPMNHPKQQESNESKKREKRALATIFADMKNFCVECIIGFLAVHHSVLFFFFA